MVESARLLEQEPVEAVLQLGSEACSFPTLGEGLAGPRGQGSRRNRARE